MSEVNMETDNILYADGLEVEESNISLNLRKLNTTDIFAAARMVKRLSIKEELKALVADLTVQGESAEVESEKEEETSEKSKMEIGIDIFFSVLEIFTNENAEQELYQFLSGPLGISAYEVGSLELERIAEALMKIADIERWKDFLSRVARSK